MIKTSRQLRKLECISEKTKYRIRWYGDKNFISNPNFEIKKKKSLRQIKTFNFDEIENFLMMERNIIYLEELVNNKFKLKKKSFPYTYNSL